MTTSPIFPIPAGATGIDFAWYRPGDAVRPWAFVVRYLSKQPNGKDVSAAEIAFYHSIGVAVSLVWEQGAADWQQGAALGSQHGSLAAQFAAQLDYPRDLPIMFAYDTNAAPADPRAYAYGTAAQAASAAGGYPYTGIYGDLDVMRVLRDVSVLNWLAGATSWSDPTKPYQPETMPDYDLVHVRQIISGSTPNYDNNITIKPFNSWLPHEVTDPVQPQGDSAMSMSTFTHSFPLDLGEGLKDPGFYYFKLMDDGTKRRITGVELVVIGERASAAALDQGQFAQIPDWVPPAAATVTEGAPHPYAGSGTITLNLTPQ